MSGKKMEGNEEQKRKKAREAKERGNRPSEEGATSGASKQRQNVDDRADHREKLEKTREGKQKVIRENTPEPRPGYGGDEE